MKKILVLCDFSEQTTIALDIAVQIAKKINGIVRLLHVLNFPSIGEILTDQEKYSKWDDLVRQMEEGAKKKMDNITAKYSADNNILSDVMMGSIIIEILSYQKERDFDLMVLGVKKESDFGAHYFGSFTDRIVHKSSIPVLVVKEATQFRSVKKVILGNAFTLNKSELLEKISIVKSLLKDVKIDLVRVNTPTDFMSEDVFDDRVKILKGLDNLSNCSFHSINHSNQGNGLIYYASKTNANMIVIGDKHSSTLRRWVLGEDLAEHSMDFFNIPVLIL